MSKRSIYVVFFILSLTAFLISNQQIVKENNIHNRSAINQVDHILLTPKDPRGLFNFLSQELKMPVVWQYQEYPGFASGGVFAGNVNLEALRFQNEAVNTPSKIAGIAFEPSAPTDELVKVLKDRQIPYAEPKPYEVGPDGSKMKFWTTTIIENILPGSFIFVCEYHIFNPALMRENMQQTFKKVDGGPLGIEYINEITIKLKDRAADFKKWQNLLKPYRCSPDGCFELGKGPSLRFLESDKDYIHSLRIKVKSIKIAKEHLVAKGLVGSTDKHKVTTNPDKTFGILFEFFESEEENCTIQAKGTVDITSQAEIVWDWIVKLEKYLIWNTDFSEYEIVDAKKEKVGTIYYIVGIKGGRKVKINCVVTEWKKNHVFSFRGESDDFNVEGTYTIEPIRGGCRVNFEECLEYKGAERNFPIAPFIQKIKQKNIEESLQRLKEMIES